MGNYIIRSKSDKSVFLYTDKKNKGNKTVEISFCFVENPSEELFDKVKDRRHTTISKEEMSHILSKEKCSKDVVLIIGDKIVLQHKDEKSYPLPSRVVLDKNKVATGNDTLTVLAEQLLKKHNINASVHINDHKYYIDNMEISREEFLTIAFEIAINNY